MNKLNQNCITRTNDFYPERETKLFQNPIFYSPRKILNNLKKKYYLKITIEEVIQLINTLLLQDPLYNLEAFLIDNLHKNWRRKQYDEKKTKKNKVFFK